ncbi:MAG: GDSL-type esterase/lipase family protein [Lachnospiraceae bacterium]
MQILCIGDSNTWGYNPENGLQQSNRWTMILAGLMPENEIIEEGMCGRTLLTVDPFEPQWCGIDALPEIIAAHKTADMVIVMLGTNELKAEFRCSAEYIAEGIEAFIKVFQNPQSWANGRLPKILIISPILLGDEIVGKGGICTQFDKTSLEESKRMAAAISNICKRYGVEFMDAAKYAKVSLTDAIHMDEANHVKFGNAIYKKLCEM